MLPLSIARNLALTAALCGFASAQADGPALGTNRIFQADIESGAMTVDEIRAEGLRVFCTPFNQMDGYGDGAVNPLDPISPGGRPTLQGNGTFLRVNGLDAQSCLECHGIGSAATIPATFAVGGVGPSSTNVIFQPRRIDVIDAAGQGMAGFNGRFINPPFLFGSGGLELLALEMTAALQQGPRAAFASPDSDIPLVTHGVSFGSIRFDSASGAFDYSLLDGIGQDLVVRPFGRKGSFQTVRGFDVEAMRFHFGIEPSELVGGGVDADGDGVSDEVLAGEISAMHVFGATLERPEVRDWTPEADRGLDVFEAIGCAACHIPSLSTRSRSLPFRFPEVETAPQLNQFLRVDLTQSTAGFDPAPGGGLQVPLFSDLKLHDMGPGLAETFGNPDDALYTTARLWGVADTAPYLHDGRATTLTDAILLHGGEAQGSRDAFAALPAVQQVEVLTFLKRLRTPLDPAGDLLP
ncbi:hypothetical protein N9Z54_06265 [Planctomycetota bacterium]|nr:hypothetical protein [Planctomycetota bacterium]